MSRTGVTEPLADRSFEYDDAGNRTRADGEPAYYNEVNQLTGIGEPEDVVVSGTVNTPSTISVNGAVVTATPSTEFSTELDLPLGETTLAISATNAANVGVTNVWTYDVPPKRGLSYDANGNLIDDGERTYQWDAADRLVAINETDSGKRSEFSYDAFGRRVRIVEKDGLLTTKDRRFVWDGLSIAECRMPDGETVENDILGKGSP